MVKKGLWLIAAALIVGLFASAAMALDPIGKPAAGLVKGQWSAAFEFAWTNETLEVSGPWMDSEDELKDVEYIKYYGRFAYGPADDWEVFGRLGMVDLKADCDADFVGYLSSSNNGIEFDPSGKFAYGLGVKHTFIDDGKTKWGGVFQYSATSFGSSDLNVDAYPTYDACIEGKFYEMQFAFGPSWMASDNICIYGGPFLHFREGDFEISDDGFEFGDGENFETEQESEIGGFLGLQADLGGGVFAGVEGQMTADAWLLTGNVGILLGP